MAKHNAQTVREPLRPDYARRAQWGGSHWPMMATRDFDGELTITRVPLNNQGYTKGRYPRYFGTGALLFNVEGRGTAVFEGTYAQEKVEDIDFYVGAADRAAAKAEVRRMYPNAKIGR